MTDKPSGWRFSAGSYKTGQTLQSKPTEGTARRAIYDELMANPARPLPSSVLGRRGQRGNNQEIMAGYGLDIRTYRRGRGRTPGTIWLVGYLDESGRYVDCVAEMLEKAEKRSCPPP